MKISTIIQVIFWFILLVISCYYFISLVVYPLRRKKYIKKRAEKTIAIIIDYESNTDPDGATYYSPVLEFNDKNGKKIIVRTEIGKTYKYEHGKQLVIYYLPNNPYEFYIIGSIPFEIYLLPFGVISIGLIVYALIRTISIL